jgi:hypothetical protein
MNTFQPFTVAERIAMTLDGLYRAVAARSRLSVLAGRGTEVLAGWLINLICTRVRRTQRRILRLLARFQVGRPMVASPRGQSGGGGGGGNLKVPRRAEGKVPRRLAWLLPLVPCEAANYACQLRLWLAEPEMVALLAASAQARRVLKPLLRMLGIEAELLTPWAKGAAVPAVATPAKVLVRRTPQPVDWGRIPLPRGVLTAAKRERPGKT